MILAAGLLVLAGLGLFVGGILTGMTSLYWGCVAACVLAAVLLYLARRKLGTTPTPTAATAAGKAEPAAASTAQTSSAPTSSTTSTAPAEGAGQAEPAATSANGATAAPVAKPPPPVKDLPDPPVEDVEVTDLLMVVDLTDEVLVIDERPRYHLPGCKHLVGHTGIPLPLDEARTDGFTPCAVCAPDRNLAQRARERKAAGSG
ncbi:MAG TPA: hypothetical protein VE463_19170 [Blastococcus sp.]|nr:hypothetical protein [Blastococcus sp.]